MAQEFRLPDIGEGLTEAEVVRWLVEVGERVETDQPVVEVETDKAVVEIPSPYAGVVLGHGAAAGEVIAVGSVLLVVGDPGEAASEESVAPGAIPSDRDDGAQPPPAPDRARGEAAPIVGTLSEDAEVLAPRAATASGGSVSVKALPIVRKMARENGIDLTTVVGTGPDGRITREDVTAAIAASSSAPPSRLQPAPAPAAPTSDPAPPAPAAPTSDPAPPAEGAQRMSRLRRTIAANMSKSWTEIPHVTTFDEVDATRLLETRAALGRRHEKKIPVDALIIKAILPALDSFPEFNASLEGESLVLHSARDIGIAVDTPDGLMVAVVKDADGLGVLDLADEVARLGGGARERTLGPDELGGQTFTVSNIGAVGGGHGTPIIPYGTTAILSVGRARAKPVVYEGDIVVAPVLPLSLSYDHRVIDGAQGRRFMALVMENLEEPALFLAR